MRSIIPCSSVSALMCVYVPGTLKLSGQDDLRYNKIICPIDKS